jgi:hypothetical protein
MDKKSGRHNSANELKEEIAESRERLVQNLRGLRYELDFPRKIRRSFRTQPMLWIGGAVAIGAVLMILSSGKRIVNVAAKTTKPSNKLLAMGFALGALRIASELVKPVIVKALEKKLTGAGNRR